MLNNAMPGHLSGEAMASPAVFDALLWEALPELTLNIAQTAALCGISVRQLGYWTLQGYVMAQGRGSRRCYGLESVRRLLAIRRAMEAGASLRQALRSLSGQFPSVTVAAPALPSPALAPAASSPVTPEESLVLQDSLLHFFEGNRHTRDDAGGLAIKVGRSEKEVRFVAEKLVEEGRLVKSVCQGTTIFQSAEQEASSHARTKR